MLARMVLIAALFFASGCYEEPAIISIDVTPDYVEQQECDSINEHLDGFVHSIEVASDGALLVAVGGRLIGGYGYIVRSDSNGCVTSVLNGIEWPHSARDRVINGNRITLVTETGKGRILLIDASDVVIGSISVLSDSTSMVYPNNADWLSDTSMLVTDRDTNRVIEMGLDGTIYWQYGGSDLLQGPHSARRLPTGNTLISDSENDRIIEVDQLGSMVWHYLGNLDWPRGVARKSNGNTVIVSSKEMKVKEVSPMNQVLWEYAFDSMPYETAFLADGSLLSTSYESIVHIPAQPIN